jgi:hypothetical protein
MKRTVEVTDIEVVINFSGKVDVWEENYGEDLDGHRGMPQTMAEISENFSVLVQREINRPENLDAIEAVLIDAALNQEE